MEGRKYIDERIELIGETMNEIYKMAPNVKEITEEMMDDVKSFYSLLFDLNLKIKKKSKSTIEKNIRMKKIMGTILELMDEMYILMPKETQLIEAIRNILEGLREFCVFMRDEK